jgi:signal transduction histidine kinase
MRKHATNIPELDYERFDPFWRHRSSPMVRYAVAALSVLVAVILTGWIKEAFPATPNALFFCAIILSGWFGGFGPGMLASVLLILAVKFYFTPPYHSLAFSLGEMPRFTVFLVAGGFISWLGDRQRRDEEALMHARDDLEGKVQARTAALTTANERLTAEIAERSRAENELQRLNRAWRVRNACNQAVNRCSDETELLAQVCRAVVEEGGYRLAWVGYAGDGAAKPILPVAHAGEAQHYLDDLEVTWGEGERGMGPTGTAIRTGQAVACNEISTDPRLEPWRASAEKHGLTSLVALPLAADGSAIGGLTVYSDEPEAFDEKETDLLQQAATDLTHGVVLLRTRMARQRAEEALKKTEEELGRVARVTTMGELAASIAHEVNQPLAAVVTNGNACLRWLSADPPNLDEARTAVSRIVRDGNRAGDVIARIRALLRKGEPVARPVDINEIIREMVALTRSEVHRRGASLQTDLATHLPTALGDRVRLQQLLLNLVLNALDAMSAVTDRPRLVRIRTNATEPKWILVAVEDAGVGLDPEQVARLFDAFYTTKPEGLGMGLSISRSIVEAHSGRLWATPNEGPGATFQFTLPIGEGAGA